MRASSHPSLTREGCEEDGEQSFYVETQKGRVGMKKDILYYQTQYEMGNGVEKSRDVGRGLLLEDVRDLIQGVEELEANLTNVKELNMVLEVELRECQAKFTSTLALLKGEQEGKSAKIKAVREECAETLTKEREYYVARLQEEKDEIERLREENARLCVIVHGA